jgi:nicotinamidase-related amidase
MDRAGAFEAALKPQPGKTALLVVDMQRGFLDPGEAMEVPPARDIIPQIRTLLDLFREKQLPVLFDIIGRAYARVVTTRQITAEIGRW